MEDLFERTGARVGSQTPLESYEWLWAERVIREVNEEVAREERKIQDFVRAWVRWNDLASFVSYVDLWMIRRQTLGTAERNWHETLLTGLISLGGLIREWSKSFPSETLVSVDYDRSRLNAQISTLKESWDLWHGESSPGTDQALTAALDARFPRMT